jgi:hypothetical protein
MMPFRALIRRELVTTLRRWWLFLLLLLAAAGTSFSLLGSMGRGASDGTGLLLLGYLAALLLVPGMGAAAFAEDRDEGTLDLLRTTHVTAGQLLLAKLISVTGAYLLLITGMLPAVGVAFFYQGMDTTGFLGAFALIASGTVMLASIGLRMSLGAETAVQATGRSYACGGVLIGVATLLADSPINNINIFVLPILLVLHGNLTAWGWCLLLGGPLLVAALFLASAWLRLRRTEHHRPRMRIQFWPDRKRPARPIPRFINPILAKDLLQNRYFSVRGLFVFTLLMVVAILLPASFGGDTLYMGGEVFLVLPFLAGILIWPGVSAANLAREQGNGRAGMLGSTLISPGVFARGKLLSACLPVWALQTACLLGAVALWWMRWRPGGLDANPVSPLLQEHLLPILALMAGAPSLVLIGLIGAAYARRMTASLVLAYIATFVNLFILPVTLMRVIGNHHEIMGLTLVPGAFYVFDRAHLWLGAMIGALVHTTVLYPWFHVLMTHHLRSAR